MPDKEKVSTGRQMKVLFLGHCSYYHIQNMAEIIKANLSNVEITAADVIMPDGKRADKSSAGAFDEFIKLPKKSAMQVSAGSKLRDALEMLTLPAEGLQLAGLIAGLKLKKARGVIHEYSEEKLYSAAMKQLLSHYDVFHFHYIAPDFLTPLKYIAKDKFVVLHIWGSDLLKVSGIENYSRQLEAIERADMIIANTLEIRELFLTKFGRRFMPKIRKALFVFDNDMMSRLTESNRETARERFRKNFGIPADKIIVAVGYNATSDQKHIEIISQLSKLPASMRGKLHVMIPMTYGLQYEKSDYLDSVKSACSGAGFDSTVIDRYMAFDEMVDYTVSTDIKLNLRDTDNMNTSMLETYCTSAIAVNGAWMPYGTLRRIGIYFREIESIDRLSEEMEYVLENLKEEKEKTANNASRITGFFGLKRISGEWKAVYEEIYNSQITGKAK